MIKEAYKTASSKFRSTEAPCPSIFLYIATLNLNNLKSLVIKVSDSVLFLKTRKICEQRGEIYKQRFFRGKVQEILLLTMINRDP